MKVRGYKFRTRTLNFSRVIHGTLKSSFCARQPTDNTHLSIPRYRTTKMQKCIKYQGVKVWNSIPQEIRSCSFRKFKLQYKEFLLAQYCN